MHTHTWHGPLESCHSWGGLSSLPPETQGGGLQVLIPQVTGNELFELLLSGRGSGSLESQRWESVGKEVGGFPARGPGYGNTESM